MSSSRRKSPALPILERLANREVQKAPTRIKGRALPPPPVREVLRNEADLADEQRRQRVLDRQVDLLCGVNDELFAPER